MKHNSENLGIPTVDPNDADDQPPGMVDSSEDEQADDAEKPDRMLACDENEDSEPSESDTLPIPLRAQAGENKFLECIRRHLKEHHRSTDEVTASDWEQIVKRIQSEVALEANRSAIAEKVMTSSASSPHTTHPFGSVSAWLANADDDSQRRKNHDHEATGHSSKSKPTELTAVDMMGSPIDPAIGSRGSNPGAIPLRHISGLGGISNVGEAKWIEIEITVDSGACETVMPMSWCRGISVLSSRQYMDGVEYEVANGETIPNLGERRCLMSTAGSLSLIHI